MPTLFPGADDVFTPPSSPASTPLSSPGDGPRSHTQEHRDLGDAIEALQANVALRNHDHSGVGARATNKLQMVNTHEGVDTDQSALALHHTLGKGPTQAAPGDHVHDGINSSVLGISSIQGLTEALAAKAASIDVSKLLGNNGSQPYQFRAFFRTTRTDSKGYAWISHPLGRVPQVVLCGIRTNGWGFAVHVAPSTIGSESFQVIVNAAGGVWAERSVQLDFLIAG